MESPVSENVALGEEAARPQIQRKTSLPDPPRPGVQGCPTWIGGADDHLAAWVHTPGTGTATGVVVIAGPVGRESVITFRTLRALAIACARAGLVAVRFAWRGDGDSPELDEAADPAEAWCADLTRVQRYAARLLPGRPVTTLGLRLGCTIAARTGAVERLISWEPIDGRHQLREQQLLRSLSVQVAPEPGVVETPGRRWTSEQAAQLRRLRLPAGQGPRTHVIREEDRELAERLYAVPPHLARVPWTRIDQIVAMVPRGAAGAVEFSPTWSVRTIRDGVAISEEFVSVDGLPGVLTRPVGEPRLAVVFTSIGGEPRDGGTGLWAQSARELAAVGAASLRCERTDQGDAYTGVTDGEPNPFNDQGVMDCVSALRALARSTPGVPVMAVGACIGMWLFGRAARSARIDRMVILNPTGWNPRAYHYRNVLEGPWLKQYLRHLHVDRPLTAEDATGGQTGYQRAKRTAKSIRQRLLRMMPRRVWTCLARIGVLDDAAVLLGQIPQTTAVQLHIGTDDAPHWRTERGSEAVTRLSGQGRAVTCSYEHTLDHSLLAQASRARARRIILDAAGLLAADA